MNSSRFWPVSGLSVSSPRMIPETTSMPKLLIVRIPSMMGTIML